MRVFLRAIVTAALICTVSVTVFSEMMPVKPGTVDHYLSDNGKYEVEISHGDGFPSWSLKEGGQVLWSRPMMNEPGAAEVSDNGETILLPLWGWRDEGGSKGVEVYNKEGELVKEVLFEGPTPGEQTLKWVREKSISPDGKYFAVGEDHSEAATVTLFNVSPGDVVWEKAVGYPDITQIKIANGGKHVLAATRKVSAMEFVLLDAAGSILWSEKIDNNFSYEVQHYVRSTDDGSGFEVYDLASGQYRDVS